MRTRLELTLLLLAIAICPSLFAQKFDAGIFFGISHYQGDLQRSYVEILEAHHANGLFIRYNFTNKVALKLGFNRGIVSGRDSNYPELIEIMERNLSFRTAVNEVSLTTEYTFLNLGVTKKHWKKNQVHYKASAYLLFGLSGFHFNPKAFYDGVWYELQPLGTEGQGMTGYGKKYSRLSVAIPYGFGAKINLTQWSYIGFEVGYRKTFTDYIDDVSGNYPDLEELVTVDPMAARLSFRTPEVKEGNFSNNPKGEPRGSAKWKDSFVFLGVTAAVRLQR